MTQSKFSAFSHEKRMVDLSSSLWDSLPEGTIKFRQLMCHVPNMVWELWSSILYEEMSRSLISHLSMAQGHRDYGWITLGLMVGVIWLYVHVIVNCMVNFYGYID